MRHHHQHRDLFAAPTTLPPVRTSGQKFVPELTPHLPTPLVTSLTCILSHSELHARLERGSSGRVSVKHDVCMSRVRWIAVS